MQALLFEMTPRDGHEGHYFRHAATLRPIVMQHEGLVYIERFKSLSRPRVILSHSLWRDEASIARWRTDREHHKSQVAGRYQHFEDYRIRISHVFSYAEPDMPQKEWSRDGAYNVSAGTADRFVTVIRSRERPSDKAGEVFESVTEPGSYLSIGDGVSEGEARAIIDGAKSDAGVLSALLGRVTRDYGMYDRAEAPQYFAPVGDQ